MTEPSMIDPGQTPGDAPVAASVEDSTVSAPRYVRFFAKLREWAPAGIASALVLVAVVYVGKSVSDIWPASLGGLSSSIVVFDPVKLANAERAVASSLIGKTSDVGQAGVLLARVRGSTEAAIRQVAGGGTLILVKQAVVVNTYPDITDKVLTLLGLPTEVPTTTNILYADDMAPTNQMAGAVRENMEGRMDYKSYQESLRKGGSNAELVP